MYEIVTNNLKLFLFFFWVQKRHIPLLTSKKKSSVMITWCHQLFILGTDVICKSINIFYIICKLMSHPQSECINNLHFANNSTKFCACRKKSHKYFPVFCCFFQPHLSQHFSSSLDHFNILKHQFWPEFQEYSCILIYFSECLICIKSSPFAKMLSESLWS